MTYGSNPTFDSEENECGPKIKGDIKRWRYQRHFKTSIIYSHKGQGMCDRMVLESIFHLLMELAEGREEGYGRSVEVDG